MKREYTLNEFENGYKVADISSSELYPEYIKKEATDALERVKKHQKEDSVNIAFITDIHYTMSEKNRIRMARILNAYKEIAEGVEIEKLVIGGDHSCDGTKEYRIDALEELKEQFGELEFFPITGNHDNGCIWSRGKEDFNGKDYVSHKDLYNSFFSHLENTDVKFGKDEFSLYYMCDDEKKKIRYIFLDIADIDYKFSGEEKPRYGIDWLFQMSQNQIDWFLNEALNFEEEGYSIIIFIHAIPLESETERAKSATWENINFLSDITNAYKKGEKISLSFGEGNYKRHVLADFSKYKRGDIIGYIAGDEHNDKLEKNSFGIPYIVTTNAFPFFYDPPHVQRRDGDKTEIAFDIITVNKKERMIYITRVGKGEDRKVGF